jgi:hypothetical protein
MTPIQKLLTQMEAQDGERREWTPHDGDRRMTCIIFIMCLIASIVWSIYGH